MTDKTMTIHRNDKAVSENGQGARRLLKPAVDICETDAGWSFVADLPGVERDNLDIGMEQGILTIRGRMSESGKPQSVYREYVPGTYLRQFQLPEDVNVEKAEAVLSNGVLRLMLPKAEAAKPRKIAVTMK